MPNSNFLAIIRCPVGRGSLGSRGDTSAMSGSPCSYLNGYCQVPHLACFSAHPPTHPLSFLLRGILYYSSVFCNLSQLLQSGHWDRSILWTLGLHFHLLWLGTHLRGLGSEARLGAMAWLSLTGGKGTKQQLVPARASLELPRHTFPPNSRAMAIFFHEMSGCVFVCMFSL